MTMVKRPTLEQMRKIVTSLHMSMSDHEIGEYLEVLEGTMQVTRYELLEEGADGVCRFAERDSVTAAAGSAGALIPPFDHHILANADPSRASLTLHIYGGEMTHCDIFQPEAASPPGTYRRCTRQLSYDD